MRYLLLIKAEMHSLMRGSLVSFTYNVGSGAFKKSTLLRMVNQQRWAEVPRAFSMYRMGGGRVLAGLERRRKAEALMFMAGVKALQTGAREAPASASSPTLGVAPPALGAMARLLSLFTAKAA